MTDINAAKRRLARALAGTEGLVGTGTDGETIRVYVTSEASAAARAVRDTHAGQDERFKIKTIVSNGFEASAQSA